MVNSMNPPISIGAFVRGLNQRGVDLSADNGLLRVSAPRGVIDAALAEEINRRKTDILGYLNGLTDASLTIVPVDRGGPVPLGFVQQRMWVDNQLQPDTALYNLPAAWRLEGPLQLETFSRAFNAAIARHEILRLSIDAGGDEPTQSFAPFRERPLQIEDLSFVSAADRERELTARLHALRDESIDLGKGLPYRVSLIRVAPEEHVFFFMPHHVVWDGWSFDIFLRDLDEFYAAAIAGRPASLPELPIQYADYAVWHRNWLQSGGLQAQLEYWSDVLAGELTPLDLPADLPRPGRFSHRGDWEEFRISSATFERITRLAAARRGTSFMVLLAAWIAFLHRMSGQRDIVVGAPIQARQVPEVTDLVGCIVNTLCLRQRVEPESSFAHLIDAVRETCLGAYEHQDAPVEMLVERLVAQRDSSRTPLFQTMFSHQQVSRRPRTLGPLSISQVHVNPAAAATDLMLAVMEGSEGARGVIHYCTDLFLPSTVRRLRLRFENLLEAALADPALCIHDLPILTAAERATVLVEWNATAHEVPAALTAGDLFARQGWQTNIGTAVSFGTETLSYAELESRSNGLAHLLRSRGIGRGALVGLCLERSMDMIVAQLAILKSGAAYVPLDPTYPADRLAYMAEDARLALLVTHSSLADELRLPRSSSVLLDRDAAALAAQPDRPLAPDTMLDAGPGDPAYVIYTSGSTGKPKGVAVPHRALVNFLTSMAREPGLSAADRLVAVTTLSFDIAVLELLLPLLVGARIELAGRDHAVDGQALRTLLESSDATVMQATPATWRLLIDAGWKGGARFKALVGGEALPQALAQQLRERTGELWNMYGPTETTVWSTCARIADTSCGIVIGKPIANTTVYILDERRQPCPIGAPGELYIGGAGVALGYWNRPALTAERFIPDPFSTIPGATLYRTGDRARWCNDGMLEHLGRFDFQVKLRGYRIELGEIEAGIAGHPAIREVVVVARENVPGDAHLVAYVVAEDPPADLVEELRALVRAGMPEYMVPAHFVRLDALPLTANGKVDRAALPAPSLRDLAPSRIAVAPRTESERMVLDVFCGVLERADFGVLDSFFDLGGNSLSGARLMFKLRAVSGVAIPLRNLFEQPTAAGLAAVIDKLSWVAGAKTSPHGGAGREELML